MDGEFKRLKFKREFLKLPVIDESEELIFDSKDGQDELELPCPQVDLFRGWEPLWLTEPTMRTQDWLDSNECREDHEHTNCYRRFTQDIGDAQHPTVKHNRFYDTLKRTLIYR